MIGQRVGNEQRAELIGLAVGIDDRHRPGPLDFDDRVVGVGQAKGNLPARTSLRHLLVAAENLHLVGLQAAKELLGLLLAQRGEQARRVRRRRARRSAARCRFCPSTSRSARS